MQLVTSSTDWKKNMNEFDLNKHLLERELMHDPIGQRVRQRALRQSEKNEAEINLHIKTIELERAEMSYRLALSACNAARKNLEIKTRLLEAFDEGTQAYLKSKDRG